VGDKDEDISPYTRAELGEEGESSSSVTGRDDSRQKLLEQKDFELYVVTALN
jgi:hypothetical protein